MSKQSSRGKQWDETRLKVLIRDGWQCVFCGKYLKDADATVDHITPKAKGGTDDMWNLVAACRKCNGLKQDKVLTRLNYFNPGWLAHL